MSNSQPRGNYGSFVNVAVGQGPPSSSSSDSEDSDDDDLRPILDIPIDRALETMNESYIAQIREDSKMPPWLGIPPKSAISVARIRRRPILRTRSEPDFSIFHEDDARQIRRSLIKRYGGKHNTFPGKSLFRLSRRQILALISIAIVDFTAFCAMSILAPFFPHEAAKKGVPSSISGLVFSVYALVIFLVSPLMGKIISHLGPKFLLIMGIFLGGVTNILFGLLDQVESKETFIIYCFLVRIFEAVGAAAFSTASYTFIAKIFPDNIGSVLGLLETFVGLGLSVGPAIGGLLYDAGGFGLPFFSLGGLMLCSIPLNIFLLPAETYEEENPTPGRMIDLIKSPPIIVMCFVIVIASNSWGFLDPTLEPHLREFNLSAKQLGLFFLLSSLCYAISSPIWGAIADRIERTWIMISVGLIFSGLGLLLLGPAPWTGFKNTIVSNVVALAMLGISISLTILPTFEAILDFALLKGYNDDISTYGLISGLWSSMYSLGEVIGPSLGGALLENYGFPICSTVMASLCLTLGVCVLIFFIGFHRPGPLPGSGSSVEEGRSGGKGPETSDSGISENNKDSESLTSSLSGSESEGKGVSDERTPLLSRSFDQKDYSTINLNVDPQEEVPTPPRVLKDIGVTQFGAVEC